MDAEFYRKFLLTPVCTIIFYLLLYKLFRYLFLRINREDPVRPEGDRNYSGYPVWAALAIYCICTILFISPC